MNLAPRASELVVVPDDVAADDAAPILLQLDQVSISHPTPNGRLIAVDDVSFALAAGERISLLGPSGCGKSTLLRAVGGFLRPTSGEIRLRGRRIEAPGPDRMTVFQEFDQLLPWRTVLGNVRYAVQRGKALPRREADEIARHWLGRVGLGGFLDAQPHTLSGGMKQRVAIARAFALQPDLLLMDEPFAALDALTRRQVQDELLKLCEDTGCTALFVTHAIDEAIRVGTRVVAMTPRPGRIAATFEVPPHSRIRGTAAFAKLEQHIHHTVFAEYLWFRCSKPPFNDVRVRMAACHAINRDVILDILGSAGHASANFVSPVKFGYCDLANYPKFDPAKCQELLAQAGFPKGKGLPPLEYITSVGFYPKTKEYGEVLTAMLNEQGFNVTLTVLEPAAWNERLYHRPGGGPGHMVDCGWSTGSPEPDLVLRTHFYSKSHRICGIEDAEIDASLDKERSAPTLEERKKVLQTETMPLIASKMPALSLFTSVMIHAMQKEYAGLFIYPDGSIDASKTA